jgi:hypothetical protein
MVARNLIGQNSQLSLGARNVYSRLQPADDRQRIAPTGSSPGSAERGNTDRCDCRGAKTDAKSKEAGSTPTTVTGSSLSQFAIDDSGIRAETPLPKAMAQNNGFRSIPLALAGVKQPAELRLDAEELKEISGHRHAAETLGLSLAAEQVIAYPIESEVSCEV